MNKETIRQFFVEAVDDYLAKFDDNVLFGGPVSRTSGAWGDMERKRTLNIEVSAMAQKKEL